MTGDDGDSGSDGYEQYEQKFTGMSESEVILEMCAISLERCGALPRKAELRDETGAVEVWDAKKIEQLWLSAFG